MKKSILFAIAYCVFFFIPSILPYLLPQPAAAEEADLEDEKQFALMFFENVAKINISAYTVRNFSYSYTPGTSVEKWDFFFRLNRGNESIGLALNIYNGIIVRFICYGEPLHYRQARDKLTTVREILEEHVTLLNASYCSQFAQLLDQAVPDQNQIIKSGNLTFKTATNSFEWLYTANDKEVNLKSFRIGVSDEGYLTMLLNWWGIMSIGFTEINISREQAINIAIPYAQKYADAHGRTVEATNATLYYVSGSGGERDECAVYPEWSVDVDFEKANSGPNIYGYNVLLWADTGDVFSATPQGWMGEGSSQNPSMPLVLTVTTIAILVTTTAIVYRKRRKKKVV